MVNYRNPLPLSLTVSISCIILHLVDCTIPEDLVSTLRERQPMYIVKQKTSTAILLGLSPSYFSFLARIRDKDSTLAHMSNCNSDLQSMAAVVPKMCL